MEKTLKAKKVIYCKKCRKVIKGPELMIGKRIRLKKIIKHKITIIKKKCDNC